MVIPVRAVMALAIILVLMPVVSHEAESQTEQTEQTERMQLRQPLREIVFDLTDSEKLIVLMALKRKMHETIGLHLVDEVYYRFLNGMSLTPAGCIVLNSALMTSGDDAAPAILDHKIRPACSGGIK